MKNIIFKCFQKNVNKKSLSNVIMFITDDLKISSYDSDKDDSDKKY